MQTHEWEALLDGTTPGPWEATDERDDMGIKGPDGLTLIDVNEGWSRCTRADLALAAHAPAAVAEVIRLRRALEGRIRVWEKVADRLAAQGDHGAELMRLVLKQVTHILEGDTDE